ncbi:YebC/PmpR family DNA-binding transcriptional regulator [candidate division KSB3 bacterium]|uniref:Probable transcriptional regulatory protein CSB45_03350 n=1 Tax=candidate division KSB3 bacterium TaxID=2044937 RepID=A0A2G6E964_9BACT|nr:MAG: YebC/PmpR family DNA-binding transcriptional regulator [candidate division KSB3 bacterium]PIE29532.1 MAG: YebC/PmpR family DNA-binding transcriptional regulator [candidate division KSB3 bacterium]
MSGHSKWHSIRHKKAKVDAQRGKIFTRLIKELTVAARMGGGDPEANARLRTAMATAKAANMPADNIDRAIKKGTGELPGVTYEEITYEGYGPAGVAIMIDTMTDNKNRTVAEIRHIMGKHGGNLGANGCVAWMFNTKGIITIEADAVDEDELMEIALEAGAEDFSIEDGTYQITTDLTAFEDVRSAIEGKDIDMSSAEISRIPENTVELSEKDAPKVLKLMDALENQDDVQNIYANFDISEDILEQLEQ